MSQYFTVHVSNSDRDGWWILDHEFSHAGITVPVGFDTDGASVPWVLTWLVKRDGKIFPPAVMHDYLYRTALIPKIEADRLFLEMMYLNKVELWRIMLAYSGVSIFGGRYYGRGK